MQLLVHATFATFQSSLTKDVIEFKHSYSPILFRYVGSPISYPANDLQMNQSYIVKTLSRDKNHLQIQSDCHFIQRNISSDYC